MPTLTELLNAFYAEWKAAPTMRGWNRITGTRIATRNDILRAFKDELRLLQEIHPVLKREIEDRLVKQVAPDALDKMLPAETTDDSVLEG